MQKEDWFSEDDSREWMRVKRRSTMPSTACSAGTKQPIWAYVEERE